MRFAMWFFHQNGITYTVGALPPLTHSATDGRCDMVNEDDVSTECNLAKPQYGHKPPKKKKKLDEIAFRFNPLSGFRIRVLLSNVRAHSNRKRKNLENGFCFCFYSTALKTIVAVKQTDFEINNSEIIWNPPSLHHIATMY